MEVGVFDAKNRLSALIAEVEKGGEVTITSRGKPVARLVAVRSATPDATVAAAADRIRDRARALGTRFDWAEWQSYRDEGRR